MSLFQMPQYFPLRTRARVRDSDCHSRHYRGHIGAVIEAILHLAQVATCTLGELKCMMDARQRRL
jgi:hypothetical protein